MFGASDAADWLCGVPSCPLALAGPVGPGGVCGATTGAAGVTGAAAGVAGGAAAVAGAVAGGVVAAGDCCARASCGVSTRRAAAMAVEERIMVPVFESWSGR